MAYTTPKAIIDDLYRLVAGLNPAGKAAGGLYRYEARTESRTWADVPDSDKDRRYTVEGLTRSAVQMFGTIDEIDYGGSVQVQIMHAVTRKERDGMVRRDADLHQIAEELEKKANFPAGVSLVRLDSQTVTQQGDHWLTVMAFRINYALAAP
jgi:hypothetical protein